MLQNNYFFIFAFLGLFWQKLTKNEENWQNPNRLMKFSEIRYLDASQQNKILQKLFFDFGIFALFGQKTAKID